MRPGEEIRLVKENLAFAVGFWKAAAAGNVYVRTAARPGTGASLFSQQNGDSWDSGPQPPANLTRGAANQMRAAFALSALQARRSLAVAFPGEPIEEELPELRTALSVMHLIALAVRRSIIQPVWECPPPYRRLFHIRRLGFTLNATGLGGQSLSWDHFGGLDSYIDLLEYCAASADEAGENVSEQGKVVLPDRPSALDFNDIIGLPLVDSGEFDETPPGTFPADYNGGTPPPGRLPVMPPQPVAPAVPPPPSLAGPPSVPAEPSPDATPSVPRLEQPSVVIPAKAGIQASAIAPDSADNPVDLFVAKRCETGAGKRMLAGELYAGFLEWSHNAGQEPVSQRAFGMRLTALGLRRKRRGHGKHWWEGIRLAG